MNKVYVIFECELHNRAFRGVYTTPYLAEAAKVLMVNRDIEVGYYADYQIVATWIDNTDVSK